MVATLLQSAARSSVLAWLKGPSRAVQFSTVEGMQYSLVGALISCLFPHIYGAARAEACCAACLRTVLNHMGASGLPIHLPTPFEYSVQCLRI